MDGDRNGRPGRSYDEKHENWGGAADVTQQNQSPVVTDEWQEPPLTCPHIDKAVESGELSPGVVNELDEIRNINSQLRYGTWALKERVAAMRCAMAALPSGVRVKPLSFKDRGHNNGDRFCNTEVGQYAIGNIHGTIMVILRRVRDGQDDDSIIWEGDDWAEAEKAACDDHASRIMSAIEPTSSPYHAETVAPYAAAPAPAELKVVAMVVCHDENLEIWETESAVFKEGEELCRLTDAHAAIAAKDGVIERLREFERQHDYCCCGSRMEDHNIGSGHSPVSMFDYEYGRAIKRAEVAEARIAELEKALGFYADVSKYPALSSEGQSNET